MLKGKMKNVFLTDVMQKITLFCRCYAENDPVLPMYLSFTLLRSLRDLRVKGFISSFIGNRYQISQ